jgi:hypothetical protein
VERGEAVSAVEANELDRQQPVYEQEVVQWQGDQHRSIHIARFHLERHKVQ